MSYESIFNKINKLKLNKENLREAISKYVEIPEDTLLENFDDMILSMDISTQAEFYLCVSVDEKNKTWGGKKLIPIVRSTGGNRKQYYIDVYDNVIYDLVFTTGIPELGHGYSGDATIEIQGYSDDHFPED